MVATIRSGVASLTTMPIRSSRVPSVSIPGGSSAPVFSSVMREGYVSPGERGAKTVGGTH
jgi:hypothetical protein